MVHGPSLRSLLLFSLINQQSTSRAWQTGPLAKVFLLALKIPFKSTNQCTGRCRLEEAPCQCSKRQGSMFGTKMQPSRSQQKRGTALGFSLEARRQHRRQLEATQGPLATRTTSPVGDKGSKGSLPTASY